MRQRDPQNWTGVIKLWRANSQGAFALDEGGKRRWWIDHANTLHRRVSWDGSPYEWEPVGKFKTVEQAKRSAKT